MRAPESIRQLYAQLAGIPMETLTKAWWWERCGGLARQRTREEMEAHRRHYGSGGNCFDLAYWLLSLAREAGQPAHAVGHDFESWEAHAAIVVAGPEGAEYLCDPGDLWLQPILISPEAPDFSPEYHPGFFPAAAVRVERTGSHLAVCYRRPNGKESRQSYDLTPVSDERFLRACHHSQNLLRKTLVEHLCPYPPTGEVGHWEYEQGRSFWSLESGLVEEEPCNSLEGWAERIAVRTGIAPEISRAALGVYGGLKNRPMRQVEVVGAVIANQAGEILCAQRSPQMSQAGLWEFPGGKIEPGESPSESLRREIREELGCDIAVDGLVADTTYPYPDLLVRLITYRARLVGGEPIPREHAQLRWTPVEQLESLDWAPADLPTVRRLQQGR